MAKNKYELTEEDYELLAAVESISGKDWRAAVRESLKIAKSKRALPRPTAKSVIAEIESASTFVGRQYKGTYPRSDIYFDHD